MMGTQIIFDPAAFRVAFPAYADVVVYPDATLQASWNTAILYISSVNGGCYCGGFTIQQQTLALQNMTAHLLYLQGLALAGEQGGILTGATIDKVSVQLEPPPSSNNWQYWLNQSPYGQALLALLQVAGVGGFYFGGTLDLLAFRRPGRAGC